MILGITGDARSGKSEAAAVCEYLFGFEQYSFAAPIRKFVIDFLDLSGLEELDKIKEIPHHLFGGNTPRYVMQTLGTQWGREMVCQDIWVNRCIEMAQKSELAVISDVRFDNEAQKIIDAGGRIIKVYRPELKPIALADHESEQGISEKYISGEIINNGNIFEYRREVARTITGLFTI